MFMLASLLALLSLAIAQPLSQERVAAQPPPPPAASPSPGPEHHDRAPTDIFRLQPLAGGVYALFGRGGNIGFLVGPDAVLVIDSQFKDIAPGIVEKIKSVTDKPIKYLVNTHHHGDHVGGNEIFRPFAVIIAHDNVRKHMLASPAEILRDGPGRLEQMKKDPSPNPQNIQALTEQIEWAKKVKVEEIPAPVLTYNSELRIHVGGETLQIWHTPPAHTDGDTVIYFEKANVLHMGDLGFIKVIPVIDAAHGGSPRGYLAAIDNVLARVPANVTIVPGHGEVTNVEGIKVLRQYIEDLTGAAQKAKAAGKSKEDFVKEIELPAYKDWNGYPARFKGNAGAAYDEVR